MNAIIEFLKKKNISSHTIAVAVSGMSVLIMSDQQIRDFIIKLFVHHPDIATGIIGMAGIIAKYSHSTPQPVAGPDLITLGPIATTNQQASPAPAEPPQEAPKP